MAIRKKKLQELQEAYDLGYEHGRKTGMIDKQHEIISLLTDSIESIDWIDEGSMDIRDVLPLIKNINKPKVIDTWAEFEKVNN